MKDTEKVSSIMIEGAIKKVKTLLEKNQLDGIISFGGASNTAIATAIMKSLPFGIPKVMLSSTAAMPAYAGGYFGTKDITMIHSVVDIAGLNPLVQDRIEEGGRSDMWHGGNGRRTCLPFKDHSQERFNCLNRVQIFRRMLFSYQASFRKKRI